MTSSEIRQSFLDFFKSKGHTIVASAPVIPHGDPTLLFTNAGMNQFKDVFLGIGNRDYKRAADTQKCIRVSGKHNDLEEVGVDTYHHTFFEMLGNWSFGDYYKKEAIDWAWELLTDVWKLDPNRLYATVYRTDDEAYDLWKRYLPESRIQKFDEKDNFWEMGETGPCGPCSEIHYDRTPDMSGAPLVNMGSPDVVEVWNLVFIQYNRKPDGELEALSSTHVDTGMGFERICAVIQGKNSNYDTDVFMPLINKISELSKRAYNGGLEDKDSIAMRVIADHIRTLSFAIADGALPGNDGRGYVLRRILRRGARFARNLGFNEPMMYKLIPILVESFGDIFPEIKNNIELITKIVRSEEESFLQTLERGLTKFDELVSNSTTISGSDAFLLYDTFGFPLDLTQLIARERNLSVDTLEFDKLMNEQKNRSRASRKNINMGSELPHTEFISQFVGYDIFQTQANILFIQDNLLVCDITPFYSESGGQVSDTGKIVIDGTSYEVIDVKKNGQAIFHLLDRNVETNSQVAYLEIDYSRRKRIMRNHSATHLLHEALRTVLGNHIKQAGSLVAPDYLRFDFNHFEKPSQEQLSIIEDMVNSKIFNHVKVSIEEVDLVEAQKNQKIKMFFGDKYGERVRVVTMDPKYSMELCGGTHVSDTSEIAMLKILSESSIAAGVRRIEAITGDSVAMYIRELNNTILNKEHELANLSDKLKHSEKELNAIKINKLSNDLLAAILQLPTNNVRIFASKVEEMTIEELRDLSDNIRNKVGTNCILLLVSSNSEKAHIACAVTDDLKSKYPAGKLVSKASQIIGGNGGGKPHLATAGGKDIENINKLINQFDSIVNEF
ncbi:MAG TPA: alanine--tRNA ligase [Candidatus Kapabacteria bacterium]|nr:alanine--tRNA ligase [Candidatus Kapabacteria bacterium]